MDLLNPSFDVHIWDNFGIGPKVTEWSPAISSPTVDLSFMLGSNSSSIFPETSFVYGFLQNLPVGGYLLVWSFSSSNCSENSTERETSFGYRDESRDRQVMFTVQKGGHKFDIATPLASEECAGIGNFAFNMTDTVPIPAQSGQDPCPMRAGEMPLVKGNPCAVTVGVTAASAIEAAITQAACRANYPVASCLATTEESAADGSHWGEGLKMGMGMVVIGGMIGGWFL